MTAYPTEANALHWWLVTIPAWSRLHAVEDWPGCETVWDLDTEEAGYGAHRTKARCGRVAAYAYAGVVSRFSLPRCAHCCRSLGVPFGFGTPVNEKAAS